MGCASSSPLTVNGGPGGLVESAKTAAAEIMTSGEKAMNDVGENLAEQVTHAKDTIVESINGVTNSIAKKKDDAITEIPLKDPSDADDSHLIEENFENLKNEMLTKAQNAMEDAEKIADDLIKDTEDVIRDAETGIVDMKNEAMEKMDAMKEDVMDAVTSKSPTHSLDSLKTSVPEPEIENLLNGDADAAPVEEATVDELEELNKAEEESSNAVEETPTAPEESPAAEEAMDELALTPSAASPEQQMEQQMTMKMEDDLVVEDVKSTDESSADSAQTGKKLEKSFAVDEEDSSDDEMSNDDASQKREQAEEAPAATHWEEMHDIYFRKRFSRPLNASVESLMEDEECCTINLANMYSERESNLPMNENESSSPTTTTTMTTTAPRPMLASRQKLSSDTLDVIDKLIRSIEKEVTSEDMNVEIPIVSAPVDDTE